MRRITGDALTLINLLSQLWNEKSAKTSTNTNKELENTKQKNNDYKKENKVIVCA